MGWRGGDGGGWGSGRGVFGSATPRGAGGGGGVSSPPITRSKNDPALRVPKEGESSEQTDPCVWKRGPARILRHRPRTGATAATPTPVLAGPSARTAPGRACARAGSRRRAQATRHHRPLAERGGFPIFDVRAHAGGQGASGSRRD